MISAVVGTLWAMSPECLTPAEREWLDGGFCLARPWPLGYWEGRHQAQEDKAEAVEDQTGYPLGTTSRD